MSSHQQVVTHDVISSHELTASTGDLHDLCHDYAAHVVLLAQIDHEASHTLVSEPTHKTTSHSLPPKPPVPQPFPHLIHSAVIPQMLTPAQLRRRREELAKKQSAELQTDQEEAERQACIRRERETTLRQQAEDDERRRLAFGGRATLCCTCEEAKRGG